MATPDYKVTIEYVGGDQHTCQRHGFSQVSQLLLAQNALKSEPMMKTITIELISAEHLEPQSESLEGGSSRSKTPTLA